MQERTFLRKAILRILRKNSSKSTRELAEELLRDEDLCRRYPDLDNESLKKEISYIREEQVKKHTVIINPDVLKDMGNELHFVFVEARSSYFFKIKEALMGEWKGLISLYSLIGIEDFICRICGEKTKINELTQRIKDLFPKIEVEKQAPYKVYRIDEIIVDWGFDVPSSYNKKLDVHKFINKIEKLQEESRARDENLKADREMLRSNGILLGSTIIEDHFMTGLIKGFVGIILKYEKIDDVSKENFIKKLLTDKEIRENIFGLYRGLRHKWDFLLIVKIEDFYMLNKVLNKIWNTGDVEDTITLLADEVIDEIVDRISTAEKRGKIREISEKETHCERIYIDDIDSFKEVRKIKPHSVKKLVPIQISEDEIKNSLAEIIGEMFIHKDWPGEKSDLYTTQIVFKGKRMDAAFVLKGPSIGPRLTIRGLGVRGNQVLRLSKEPAQLFIVQHVGEIDSDVIEHLENQIDKQSKIRNLKLYYCTVDGTDIARILVAYNKLKLNLP